MVNHSALCRSIKYDYINILTWTILKKIQILNGCETFAFKYIFFEIQDLCFHGIWTDFQNAFHSRKKRDGSMNGFSLIYIGNTQTMDIACEHHSEYLFGLM